MKKPKSKRKSKTHQHQLEATATTAGDFSFSITRVAVSQICRSAGFRRSQVSALETLTLVATRYLEALATRTQSNLLDLTNALHDLSLQTGFLGASTLYYSGCCLLKSSLLEDLSGFISSTDEITFSKPIERATEQVNALFSPGTLERGGHIPEWLPGFPDVGSNKQCDRKRVNGEVLWENSSSVLGCQSNGFEVKANASDGCKLAKKTSRVKFRINGGGKREHLNRYSANNGFSQTKYEDADAEAEAEAEAKAESEKPVKPKEAQIILVYKRRKL